MALRMVSTNPVPFTPTSELSLPENTRTVIYCRPLSKAEKDSYSARLFDTSKGKIKVAEDKTRRLFSQCLCAENGVFIRNVFITKDGKEIFHSEITDKETAVMFLCGMQNTDAGDEIEEFMLGHSVLSGEQEKN